MWSLTLKYIDTKPGDPEALDQLAHLLWYIPGYMKYLFDIFMGFSSTPSHKLSKKDIFWLHLPYPVIHNFKWQNKLRQFLDLPIRVWNAR